MLFLWRYVQNIWTYYQENQIQLSMAVCKRSPFRAVLPIVVLFPVGSTVSGGFAA